MEVDSTRVKYPVVIEAMRQMGYHMVPGNPDAVLYWYDGNMPLEAYHRTKHCKRVNKIPQMDVTCYKSTFFNALNQMQLLYPQYYTFFPKSFFIPYQFQDFQREFLHTQNKPNTTQTWIVKPQSGCSGIGIQLIQNPFALANYTSPAVVQKYISPYLVDGHKFDFRLYILIGNIYPFQAFLYKEGIARFCTEKYVEPTVTNLTDKFQHITNTAVNVGNPNPDIDFTQLVSSVISRIRQSDSKMVNIWSKIANTAALSMIAVYPNILQGISKDQTDNINKYFHLVGMDIMIDSSGNPMVLEINDRPSLCVTFDIEKNLKTNLVADILKFVTIDGTHMSDPTGTWKELFPPDQTIYRMLINRSMNFLNTSNKPKCLMDKAPTKEIISPCILKARKKLKKHCKKCKQ